MRPMIAATLLGLTLLAGASLAKPSTIDVKDAWILAPPPGAATAAGYATITNHGPSTDRLTGARSPAARTVEVHRMTMAGGVMRMRPIPGGLPVGASATVKLSPNGDHLMFIGLKGPLKVGQHVKVVLDFARAGRVAADVPVRAAAGASMAGMKM